MATQQSLGYVAVATAGTPVVLSAASLLARAYLVEALTANTGKIYIGTSAMNKSTGVGVFAVIPAPSTGVLPSFSANATVDAGPFQMSNLYMDADNSGEGACVSIIPQG